jgi:hypothetical protein
LSHGQSLRVFGTCIIGRQQSQGRSGIFRSLLARLSAEDFRDAEIEEFGVSVNRHQNIAGLDVAVNDRFLMSESNGLADLEKKAKSFFNG